VHDYIGEQETSVEGLIAEQRRLARSKNPIEQVVGSLCMAALLKERLAVLPNRTISQLLTDQIWSQLNLLGPESVIVEIASERLLESAIAIVPKACPECGAELWRADE
jgi:hypothetical protein